jgi:plastocyanin
MTRHAASVGAGLTLWTLLSGPAIPGSISITATVHEIRLSANRFVPAQTIARAGDTLRFINGSGGPHNIQFLVDSLSGSARDLLERAMPGEKIGPVASPLLLDQQETYQFAIPDLPAGRYPYLCLPHGANGMRGAIVIVP